MMRCVLPSFLTAAVVALLPQVLAADEGQRPQRPGPAAIFQRLDANHDGTVTADEVPEKAPERLKQMLVRADKNKDKKLTAAEFRAAVQAHRGGPPHRHHGPPHAGGQVRMPDPKEIFTRLDKNKDKQINLEEFTVGVNRLRAMMAVRHRGPVRGGGPGAPCVRASAAARGPVAGRMAAIGREMFRRADANRDGKVALSEVPEDRRERFKQLLAKADKDGDEALSAEEARAAAQAMAGKIRAQMAGRVGEIGKAIFLKLDADKDGKVTVAEVPEERRERFKKLLEKADKDGDEALSAEEGKRVAEYFQRRIRSGAGRPCAEGRPCPRATIKKPELMKKVEVKKVEAKKIEAKKRGRKKKAKSKK